MCSFPATEAPHKSHILNAQLNSHIPVLPTDVRADRQLFAIHILQARTKTYPTTEKNTRKHPSPSQNLQASPCLRTLDITGGQ